MTTDVTTQSDNEPMKIFRDKVAARIRGEMAELMPDEMMKQLIEDAIKSELYRDVRRQNYSEPLPWVRNEVKEMVGKQIEVFTREYLENNKKEVETLIAERIKNDTPYMIGKVLSNALSGFGYDITEALREQINRGY